MAVNHVRESLGGGLHIDTIRDKRGLHDAFTSTSKPWDICRRFMCTHRTKSGKPEKDPTKRLCRYHCPEGIRVREDELMKGKFLASPCSSSRKKRSCTERPLGPNVKALGSGVCGLGAMRRCCAPCQACLTDADWFYRMGAGRESAKCRFTAAKWKQKAIRWKAGDPAPAGAFDDEERSEDGFAA
jgi:hypothetical protein